MISFTCSCGRHSFTVPDEAIGTSLQCPACKRLVDVPTREELDAMDDDGLLRLAEDNPPPKPDSPSVLREMHRAYGKQKFDEFGNEIDLRNDFETILDSGTTEIPLSSKDALPPGRPHYDPLTGELVRPIDLKPRAPKKARPVAAAPATPSLIGAGATPANEALAKQRRTIAYARRETDEHPIPKLGQLPLKLFEPINLMVMFFILLIFVLTCAIFIPVAGGIFIAVPALFAGYAALLAHYSNSIHDLGPGDAEELPRPLRDLELLADIWWPFVRMQSSLFATYGLAIIWFANTKGAACFVGTGVLLTWSVLMFPALALICCASGHFANIRPDRLAATIYTLGPKYIYIVLLSAVAMFFAFLAPVLLATTFVASLTLPSSIGMGILALFTFGAILLSVYLCHLAAWSLGVTYRLKAQHFPWYFEQHERARTEHKRLAALAKQEAARNRRRFA